VLIPVAGVGSHVKSQLHDDIMQGVKKSVSDNCVRSAFVVVS
jgi:hypothetical protein